MLGGLPVLGSFGRSAPHAGVQSGELVLVYEIRDHNSPRAVDSPRCCEGASKRTDISCEVRLFTVAYLDPGAGGGEGGGRGESGDRRAGSSHMYRLLSLLIKYHTYTHVYQIIIR